MLTTGWSSTPDARVIMEDESGILRCVNTKGKVIREYRKTDVLLYGYNEMMLQLAIAAKGECPYG